MYFFGYLIRALAYIINMVLTLYMWVVIAGAVLSWVNPDPYNPIVRFIHNVTEPVLNQIRRQFRRNRFFSLHRDSGDNFSIKLPCARLGSV